MKKVALTVVLGFAAVFGFIALTSSDSAQGSDPEAPPAAAAEEAGVPAWWLERNKSAGRCLTCHKEKSPALYGQWYASEHSKHGVTCLECHAADKSEADAFEHEGTYIATLVTPKDCGRCHAQQTKQVDASYHATAGLILESNDAYLAHAAGGHPAAVAGCESCHGAKIEIDPNSPNKLDATSWPNTGIGRLNPDGSKGSCTACHARHSFSLAQARRPESCGKCHLGPDHPQKEIYEESKHGATFRSAMDEMNLKSDHWVVGVDYSAAPTCATCHMSATTKQAVTHDVGKRISWTLRPPVSKFKPEWKQRRENMQDVCRSCHGQRWVDGHYRQFDGVVHLYNEKFGKPAGEIMKLVRSKKLLANQAAFSNKIEWEYWELWHHEGRRARHGASMMGPDYTWWHGIYDVAHTFYFKFLPEARHLDNAEVNAAIDKIMARPEHAWFNRPTADIKKDIEEGKLQEIYRSYFKAER
jgi:hydroxylamine dehydrogenase